jgi:hypothetical protein
MEATTHPVSVEERTLDGVLTKTFVDEYGNVEVILATDEAGTTVLIPRTASARQARMSDDLFGCLRKCRAIVDDAARIQCIVNCPASRSYQVLLSVG